MSGPVLATATDGIDGRPNAGLRKDALGPSDRATIVSLVRNGER